MREQEYKIENSSAFEPKHIFECGQCFRWNLKPDGSYIGVIKNAVLKVYKKDNTIVIKGMCKEDIAVLCEEYFDLKTDYQQIKQKLSKVDEYLNHSIEYGYGIRILNQDLWEMIISYIISANNNIPRIKGIIQRLAREYGRPIQWEKQVYYTFPTIEELAKVTVEDLRKLGLGFRDKRVYDTTQIFLEQQTLLEELQKETDISKLKEQLLALPGVGTKVADCIMLFGLKKKEVFPIDVWVRRVMNELYIKNSDETKVKKTEIEDLAIQKYEKLAGIAQQYLFYWKRDSAS